MNSRSFIQFALSLMTLFALVITAYAGGWAVITVNEFPDHAVAGQPLNLTFTVRQHGMTLLTGLEPSVRATAAGGLVAKAAATARREPGMYSAALTLPKAGDWTITITSGFTVSELTLPTLKVIAPGAAAPAAFSSMTRGLRLFTTKGCVGCHTHLEVRAERSSSQTGGDLTGKRFASDYLRKFLADPRIKPADMPNLNLKPEEIDALAGFINKDFKKRVE
jgi:mono/diheme cytochrome c family protein